MRTCVSIQSCCVFLTVLFPPDCSSAPPPQHPSLHQLRKITRSILRLVAEGPGASIKLPKYRIKLLNNICNWEFSGLVEFLFLENKSLHAENRILDALRPHKYITRNLFFKVLVIVIRKQRGLLLLFLTCLFLRSLGEKECYFAYVLLPVL